MGFEVGLQYLTAGVCAVRASLSSFAAVIDATLMHFLDGRGQAVYSKMIASYAKNNG